MLVGDRVDVETPAMSDPARDVAMLIEQLLGDLADDPSSIVVDVDMRGMMAAVDVVLRGGSVVVVEVEPRVIGPS